MSDWAAQIPIVVVIGAAMHAGIAWTYLVVVRRQVARIEDKLSKLLHGKVSEHDIRLALIEQKMGMGMAPPPVTT